MHKLRLRLRRVKMKTERHDNISLTAKELEKVDKIKKIVDINKTYKKIMYKNEIVSIGDNLMLRNPDKKNVIAELIEILPCGGIQKYPYWPSIKVKIFYSKYDINRSKNDLQDETSFESLSEFELFKSTETKIYFTESIVNKCTVYSLEDYEKREAQPRSTFFTRANYDSENQTLHPPFAKWAISCMCRTPPNPDQFYIRCDSCEKWFHPKHCGLSKIKAEKIEIFYCSKCKVK